MNQPHRTARRSASHGALRDQYSRSPGRMAARQPSFVKPRFPERLRAVQENPPGFLASPGPLASMLRTTTETGEIRIFSINSSATIGMPRQQSFRSAPGISHENRTRNIETRDGNSQFSSAERHLQSSQRDTTSEILSLYGSSGGARSRCSSLGRSYDSYSSRAYSMVSNGSRRLPLHPAHPPLPDWRTCSLQRPRSPWPYPTRLPRYDGSRPSSPVVLGNGEVDYSRRVAFQRISLVSRLATYSQVSSALPYANFVYRELSIAWYRLIAPIDHTMRQVSGVRIVPPRREQEVVGATSRSITLIFKVSEHHLWIVEHLLKIRVHGRVWESAAELSRHAPSRTTHRRTFTN